MAVIHEQKIRLSDQFLELARECEQEVLTVHELIEALGVRGHAFLALICSIPFVLLVPIPGLSVPFGVVVCIAGMGVTFGFGIWLPKWLMRRSLPGRVLAKIFRQSAKLLQKSEKILKPRLFALSESGPVRAASGVLISISGLILALPLPPGTNFPPAIVGVLLALGILERDGIVLIIGFAAFLLNITVFAGVFYFAGPWLVQWLTH
jgi:hypothetical protein